MRFSYGIAFALAVVAAAGAHAQGVKFQPVVGRETEYKVARRERLFDIARRHNITVQSLARHNGLSGTYARKGTTLKVPRMHILPANPSDGIVLNIPERAVYVFKGGKLLARHAAAVGKPSWPTALGTYKLRNKAVNPTWTPPASMVRREGVDPRPVPPGPNNPLGDRWMGWSAPGYGFHSTTSPRSIGSFASHGCVRLYPEAARRMFSQVDVGMPIHSLYRPVVLGKRNGRFYVSVHEDPYRKGGASLADVKKVVQAAGLAPLAPETVLREAVARRDGFPRKVAGEPEALEVNGLPVLAPVPLVKSSEGRWMVPARAVVEALGGRVEPNGDGRVRLLAGERTLDLRAGQAAAMVDGEPAVLPAAPTTLEGVLLVPARTVAGLFGARIERVKGSVLRLTVPPKPGPDAPGPSNN